MTKSDWEELMRRSAGADDASWNPEMVDLLRVLLGLPDAGSESDRERSAQRQAAPGGSRIDTAPKDDPGSQASWEMRPAMNAAARLAAYLSSGSGLNPGARESYRAATPLMPAGSTSSGRMMVPRQVVHEESSGAAGTEWVERLATASTRVPASWGASWGGKSPQVLWRETAMEAAAGANSSAERALQDALHSLSPAGLESRGEGLEHAVLLDPSLSLAAGTEGHTQWSSLVVPDVPQPEYVAGAAGLSSAAGTEGHTQWNSLVVPDVPQPEYVAGAAGLSSAAGLWLERLVPRAAEVAATKQTALASSTGGAQTLEAATRSVVTQMLPHSLALQAAGSGSSGGVLKTIGMLTGVGPIVTGLLKLFGGGGKSEPVAVPEPFVMPSSVSIEAGLGQDRSLVPIAYSQLGSARAVSPQVSGAQIQVNVQAMDSRSFLDHRDEIARAVREAMLNSHSLNDVIAEI